MNGEKIKIFGTTYTHYSKEVKSSDYEPKLNDLKDINRPYWTFKKKLYSGFITFIVVLLIIIGSLCPLFIGKQSKNKKLYYLSLYINFIYLFKKIIVIQYYV